MACARARARALRTRNFLVDYVSSNITALLSVSCTATTLETALEEGRRKRHGKGPEVSSRRTRKGSRPTSLKGPTSFPSLSVVPAHHGGSLPSNRVAEYIASRHKARYNSQAHTRFARRAAAPEHLVCIAELSTTSTSVATTATRTTAKQH